MNRSEIGYIEKAMTQAFYNELEDGSFCGKIPQCPGVIAFGETMCQCRHELRTSLEGWVTVKKRHGDRIPAIYSADADKSIPLRKRAVYDKVVSV